MDQAISMANAKSKLSDLVGQAAYGHKRFVLERHGQPLAVLIGLDDYKRLLELDLSVTGQFLSMELRQRQVSLVAQARQLQEQLGDPIDQLTDVLRTLPPEEDEFWLQIAEAAD